MNKIIKRNKKYLSYVFRYHNLKRKYFYALMKNDNVKWKIKFLGSWLNNNSYKLT